MSGILGFTSGGKRLLSVPSAGGGFSVTPSTGAWTVSALDGAIAGSTIDYIPYIFSADFSPTVILPNDTAAPGYDASALFFTVPAYTSKNASSIISLELDVQATILVKTAGMAGYCVAIFDSSVAATPAIGVAAFGFPPVAIQNNAQKSAATDVEIINNASGVVYNFYLCAFLAYQSVSGDANILSSASTASQFLSSVYGSIKIYETVNN